MATFQKQDLSDRVTYNIQADPTAVPPVPSAQIVVFKEGHHHVEIVADWGYVAEGTWASWQEFIVMIEAGNTIVNV